MAQVGIKDKNMNKRGRSHAGPHIKDSTYSNYRQVVSDINEVGIQNLREFLTTKKCPVRNFDRDIHILMCMLRYGPVYAADKYKVSYGLPTKIMKKYHGYALQCKEMIVLKKED